MVSGDRQRVGVSRRDTATFVGVATVGGLLLGLALGWVGTWLGDQGWLPEIANDLVDAVGGARWWARSAIGAGLGAAVGGVLLTQARVVEVNDRELVVVDGGSRHRYSRAQVTSIALEGRRMSVRDADDADLGSSTVDCDLDDLRRALSRHHWPVDPA